MWYESFALTALWCSSQAWSEVFFVSTTIILFQPPSTPWARPAFRASPGTELSPRPVPVPGKLPAYRASRSERSAPTPHARRARRSVCVRHRPPGKTGGQTHAAGTRGAPPGSQRHAIDLVAFPHSQCVLSVHDSGSIPAVTPEHEPLPV